MHFGLDIGSYSIKAIQCHSIGKKYVLDRWGEIKSPVSFESAEQKDQITLAQLIKKLVSDCQITTQNVVVALSETKVFSRVIQLPPMTDAELASAIEFEAEQYIPLPLDQVQLEYLVLKMPPKGAIGEKMEVLLIAAQKKAVDELTSLLEMSGLVPEVMETEVLAMSRALAGWSDSSLLINIGKESTDLVVVQGENLRFVYSFPSGGEALTRAVSQSLALDLIQAEEYKKAYGLEQSVLEGKVAAAIEPTFSQMTKQIQKVINFYSQNNPKDNLKRLILAGGSAEMPGISTYLTKTIGLETVLGSPFANFEKDSNFPQALAKISARFATAVGLATREI